METMKQGSFLHNKNLWRAVMQKIIFVFVLFALIGFLVVPAMAPDHFVNNSDGTVTDTKTGLMWAAQDNGSLVSWHTARTYSQNYSGGGYTDWRMPNLTELASIYDPKEKNNHGYHVTKLIDISAASCWASDTRSYKAARFNFTYGRVYWLRKSYSGPGRVLPVRSVK
jgi:hypothetical protein